MEEARKPTADS
jgi:hypothetical protein